MENGLWRLAWNNTEIRDPKKIFSGLAFGVLTIIFNWITGLRTWQQALLFIACSITAYLFLTLLEVISRFLKHWLIRRKRLFIKTPEELVLHYSRITTAWNSTESVFDQFKDIYGEVERSWREWQENKTDSQHQRLMKTFPGEEIMTGEVDHVRDQLLGAAANLQQSCGAVRELLNFSFRRLD